MNIAFMLTIIAGLATLMGVIPIFIHIKHQEYVIALACSFASGVMITLSICDLIPEGINSINYHHGVLFTIIISFLSIVIGLILEMVLEHKITNDNNLYKVGLLSMLVIILHNIPEGIVSYIMGNKDMVLGLTLCIAIAMHNIPEGISIAVPIYYSTGKKLVAIFYTLISALSEILGAFLCKIWLINYINDFSLGIIFLIIAGIMMALSYDKLLPTGIMYHKKIATWGFISGIIFMLFNLLINSLIS